MRSREKEDSAGFRLTDILEPAFQNLTLEPDDQRNFFEIFSSFLDALSQCDLDTIIEILEGHNDIEEYITNLMLHVFDITDQSAEMEPLFTRRPAGLEPPNYPPTLDQDSASNSRQSVPFDIVRRPPVPLYTRRATRRHRSTLEQPDFLTPSGLAERFGQSVAANITSEPYPPIECAGKRRRSQTNDSFGDKRLKNDELPDATKAEEAASCSTQNDDRVIDQDCTDDLIQFSDPKIDLMDFSD